METLLPHGWLQSCALATALLALSLSVAPAADGRPETTWTIELAAPIAGPPVPFGDADGAAGVLAALQSGHVVRLDSRGRIIAEMPLDQAPAAPPVAGDLDRDGTLEIVAFDIWGSVYCFAPDGARRWQQARRSKAGDFSLPVLADLEGNGHLQVVVTDSQGHLLVFDADGRLLLEVRAGDFRVSPPVVGDLNGDGEAELVFGTDDKEVHCLNARGEMLWSARVDGRFGRNLPLAADADGDGHCEVYVSTAYNQRHPGLYALDAASGRQLWKAASSLQCYNSTVAADLEGDGRLALFFGDKNTILYRVGAAGERRWATQLDGRGIFFAPALLQQNGQTRIFQVVRARGLNGKSLYVLDGDGNVLEEWELPSGGGSSPALCRFAGSDDVMLLVGSGPHLTCYRVAPDAPEAVIRWRSLRHDALNSGLIESGKRSAEYGKRSAENGERQRPGAGRLAVTGTNRLELAPLAPEQTACVTVERPDGSRWARLLRGRPDGTPLPTAFEAETPGDYRVTVRRNDGGAAQAFLYTLPADRRADRAQWQEFESAVDALRPQLTDRAELATRLAASARLAFESALETASAPAFDSARREREVTLALLSRLALQPVDGPAVVRQITNPWVNFDEFEFLRGDNAGPNALRVRMVGNEYESIALALTNLRTRPAAFRLACGPFESPAGDPVSAQNVVTLHDVPRVTPIATGAPTEDPLPRLGEAQAVRLGAGETRKLWLILNSRELPAGAHRAILRIADLESLDPPVEVPLEIEVRRLRLPERRTYRHHNWLYPAGLANHPRRDAILEDALAHGTNVFTIPGVAFEIDERGEIVRALSDRHDEIVERLRGRAFILINGSVSLRWPQGFTPDEALREHAYAAALRRYGGHMEALGVGYAGFAFYLMDEPGLMGDDASYRQWMEDVRRVKAADPRLQVYANPAGGARAAVLAPVADLISVWQPDLHLVKEEAEALPQLFGRAPHYWHYEAPGDQKDLPPLLYYRMKPWLAFRLGMTGGGWWVYHSFGQPDYWLPQPAGGGEYGVVYMSDDGPVTTRRWEASRDGSEDFELLWMVRQAAEGADPARREQALALLDEAVAYVTAGQMEVTELRLELPRVGVEFERWMEYRERLIDLLEAMNDEG